MKPVVALVDVIGELAGRSQRDAARIDLEVAAAVEAVDEHAAGEVRVRVDGEGHASALAAVAAAYVDGSAEVGVARAVELDGTAST